MRTTSLRSFCVAILAISLSLLARTRVQAQTANTYSVAYSTGATLITQTAPVSLLTAPNDDNPSTTAQAIGFNFIYEGTTYTHLVVSPDGFVKLGTSSSVTAVPDWSNSIAVPDNFPILFPWWDDMALGGSGLGGYVKYSLQGSAPNRQCVIEWFVTIPRDLTGAPNTKFQLVLNETSNTIQFIYAGTNTATFQSASVGIIGAVASNYLSLTPSSTSFSSTTPDDNNPTYPTVGTMVTLTPPAPCTGTPPAGTAVASVASVCPNTPFTVTWNGGGTTAVGGLSYQLQTSATGAVGSYTNSGAAQTAPTFNITGITATTYYRIVVTCTNTGGGNATSVADTVTVNAATQCYCAPPGTQLHGAVNDYFSNVSIAGTTLNSSNGTNSTTGYLQISAPPASNTGSLVIGTQYTLTATYSTLGAPTQAAIWIDFDASGSFNQTTEYIPLVLGTTAATATFTVPVTASPSLTGLRVRARGGTFTPDACETYFSGETEDYLVTLVAPVPCTGTPNAGTANTSNATPCPGTQVTITLGGGTIASGINFQLQSSTTSATTGFSNVTGATNASGIFVVTPPSGTTWYRIVSTCTNTGGGTATSGSVQVTGQSPISTLPWTEGIEGVTTVGPNNFPTCWKQVSGDWQSADAAHNGFNDPRTGIRYLINTWIGTNEWIMTPGFTLTGGVSYDFSFYWAGDNSSGWDGNVGVNSIQDSTGITILGAPFVTPSQTTASTYTQVIRTFTPATTGTYFFGVRVGSNGGPWYLGFDDFRLNVTPTCPQPVMGTVTNITATGAQINWTPATSTNPGIGWQIEVRTTGLPGTPGAAWTGTALPGATSATAAGLTGVTNYTAYVRAICSPGDSSFWSSTTFLTSLDCTTATAISSCGQSQSFSLNNTGGAYDPIQTTTGPNIFGTPGVEKLYTFTAPVTGTYTLDVSATNSQWVDYFYKPSAGGCANANWIFIDDIFGPTLPGFAPTLNLTAGVQYYILADPEAAFGSPTSSQTFAINCPPTCGMPTNVSVTTTTNSATISWTSNPPGSPTQWQISVAPQGSPASSGVMSVVGASPATVSGLTPSTSYSFYVRAICGPGDSSMWSAAFNIPTQCLAASLPFAENFNLSTFPPVCWSRAQGPLTSTPSALTGTTSNWFSSSWLNGVSNPAARVNIYWTTFSQREWLISPSIDLGSTPGNFQLEFDLGIVEFVGTTPTALGSDDTIAVVVSTDNGATWSLANALQIWTASNTPINPTGTTNPGAQRYYIPMNGYSGQIKIGWYGSNGVISNSTADNDIFVDSVRIITTCSPPTVDLGNDSVVCGNVTSYLLDAGPAATGATYAWSNSFDATTASTQTFNIAPVLNALNANPNNLVNVVSFYSTVTVGTNCAKSDTINVAVTYTPRVTAINAALTGTALNDYTFTPVGDSFATGYVWSFGDGGVAATANATHVYSASGTYTVRLIVSNPCGNDTVFTTVTVPVGVGDVFADVSSVNIFPNPTAADAVLEVTGGAVLRSYQVMSATGTLVQERTIEGKGVTSTTLNTDALAPGVYTLRIQLDKGVVVRKLEVLK